MMRPVYGAAVANRVGRKWAMCVHVVYVLLIPKFAWRCRGFEYSKYAKPTGVGRVSCRCRWHLWRYLPVCDSTAWSECSSPEFPFCTWVYMRRS
ncbi:hypothetical protein F5Y18DRAFT_334328 [Xylariaceae sp. FL1019]|nr:hypothetical protein F5Y18DRAFT_334328 [Xylariaceae sp. FL1019]